MNYKDEIYACIKEHPGCATMVIWDHMNDLRSIEFNKKNNFQKFIIRFFGLGLHREASLPRIYSVLDELKYEGVVRTETIDKKMYCYPTEVMP